MTTDLTLTISEADHRAIEHQLTMENLGLRQENAVLRRTVVELRAALARAEAAVREDAPATPKGRKPR